MTRWRAPYGERYFLVTSTTETDWEHDYADVIDNRRYTAGNYFQTKEEAEAVAAKFRAILDEHNKNP